MASEEISKLFEDLVRKAADASAEKLYSTGSDHLTDAQREALQQWLSSDKTQSRINSAMKNGPRREWGVVLSIEQQGKNQVVRYLNEYGTHPLFVYRPGSHPEAPNGYMVGDIILSSFSEAGMSPDTTTPMAVDPEDRIAIYKKILHNYTIERE